MPNFTGCKEAKEISLVRAGANQHAHVLITKAKKTSATADQPENHDMDAAEIAKAANAAVAKMVTWNDVTKAYYAGLAEDAQIAFMAKAAPDQKTEAETAKAAADAEAARAEAVAKGQTEKEAALEKRMAGIEAENAELKKAAKDREAEVEIEKAAADPAFAGYPGGVEALKTVLKGAKTIDAAAGNTAMVDVLKAQAQMARTTQTVRGLWTENDLSKSAPKTAIVLKKAKEIAAEKGITEQVALAQMYLDPAHKNDVLAAVEEDAGLSI